MAIKLVISDLDGTLLDRDHQISEANKLAIFEAVQSGVTVTIATGRMYPSALPYAKQLGVDVPIITYNGAVIKSVSGEILYEQCLDTGVAQEIITLCQENDWYIQTIDDDNLYFKEHNEKAKYYESVAGIKGHAVGKNLADYAKRPPKMLMITDNEVQTDEIVALLEKQFAGRITAVKSMPTYIEIIHPSVNKAAAVDRLIEKLNLSREEVMALGDSNNDLPMLKAAGLSVAMGNANQKAKAAAKVVTEDNNHSGVAVAIRKYVLQKQG
ncbi:Cof-type HAD-IIB family hydrolase [Anaerosinus sp.]|uniref:Cof-type HAD-IIB family hydrolase n=1 Tax=Selenobaculum sp. TaxID=3074374 RepID=UPI0015AAB9EC